MAALLSLGGRQGRVFVQSAHSQAYLERLCCSVMVAAHMLQPWSLSADRNVGNHALFLLSQVPGDRGGGWLWAGPVNCVLFCLRHCLEKRSAHCLQWVICAASLGSF